MPPKVYYCNTIYCKPISDINPLILQKHKRDRILVLCAREGQVKRITTMLCNPEFAHLDILHYGWWDADNMGLLDEDGSINYQDLCIHDLLIILDRRRIDALFHSLLVAVETFCEPNEAPLRPCS